VLVFDFRSIGDRLFAFRKKMGMTQADVAEKAGLSDRTYADIERGSVNMRIETVLRICDALNITPDEILTERKETVTLKQEEVWRRLCECTDAQKETGLRLLSVYLDSLK